jgi:glutamate/tyrosine decarboxylase-like PLP-dependent enzyme
MPTFALNFSRPGGEIIAQYYNFIRYGREGYRSIQQACVETARFLAGEVEAMGPFEILYGGSGLPAIAYTLKNADTAGFSLYDLSDRLRMRGWQCLVSPAGESAGHRRAADPDPPRRQPRHGEPPRRRHPSGARLFPVPSGAAIR